MAPNTLSLLQMNNSRNLSSVKSDIATQAEEDGDLIFGKTMKLILEMSDQDISGLKIERRLSSRFADLGNLYLKNGMDINFHENFRDLKPEYIEQRR